MDSFKNLKTSIYYVWGHSLATAAMFLIVNALETRYSSRNILYISGVWYTSPSFGYLMFFSLLSFLDIPLSIFFWGELCLLVYFLKFDEVYFLEHQIYL
jgi:NADH:ubiquinone oxidoreductase subunit 4 (subunit M)